MNKVIWEKYKCTNKKCKKFDVTVYNDSVIWK